MAVAPGHAESPGWRLIEVASAGRENLDPDHVDADERIEPMVRDPFRQHRQREVAMVERYGTNGSQTGQLQLETA